MARLLLWLLLGYLVYRFFAARKKKIEADTPARDQGQETHRDPVCGTYVVAEDAVVGRLEGERLYFCSRECLDRYQVQLHEKA